MKFGTKESYIEQLKKILNPIEKIIEKGGAKPSMGSSAAWYDDISTAVETFARPLWGLVPLWYGGDDKYFSDLYRSGIIEGTDPKSDKYWGECGQCDQRYVEMASIAYAMLFVPNIIWEPLTEWQKKNLSSWLWQINTHDVCDSNWRFFRVLVNLALKHCGYEYDDEKIHLDLERFEDFYIGDGWYKDGMQNQKDYYISMAIHFYSLIYSCFEDDEYSARFRNRAKKFAYSFVYWFSENGDALPYGRSLTYRFAQGAFWSACLLAGVQPFEMGVMKGIISRHLKYWMNEPIFDNGGMLSIGYCYSNLLMAEHYNSPGSPYWGLKFFAFLALSDEHEFWKAEEKPLAKLDEIKLIKAADMLVVRNNKEAYAYPAGTHNALACGQIPSKYLKFVYSTKFGFNVKYDNTSIEEMCGDNMLIFDIGGVLCERRKNIKFEIFENRIITKWSPINGIHVTTEIIPSKDYHVRKHTIVSEFECVAYEGGFAVPNRDKDNCRAEAVGSSAKAESNIGGCEISCNTGEGRIVNTSPNTNVIFNKTVIPTVKVNIRKGITKLETTVKII